MTTIAWHAAKDGPLPDDLELIRDVRYGHVGEHSLTLHVLRPQAQPHGLMPVLIGIHGGGYAGGTKDWCLPSLMPYARRGYFCVSVDHRSPREAPFRAMIEDCKCAVRFLRAHAVEYHLDPDRIGVWGISSGGHLAALLGTSAHVPELEGNGGWPGVSSRVQAVSDWFGPAGLAADGLDEYWPLFGGTPREKWGQVRLFDPITHVTPDAGPFLIMHGDQDKLVPLCCSERLHAALTQAGVESRLHVCPGAGHNLAGDEINTLMADFFDRHLKQPEPS